MFRERQERGPLVSTEQKIPDQSRAIMKNEWLTAATLEGLVRSMHGGEKGEKRTNEAVGESGPVRDHQESTGGEGLTG